jgi:hypothetical protein
MAFKKYLKKEEELWKLKFSPCKNIILKTKSLKETKILQDIITLYNN